jgi:hypothetical protein
LFQLILFLWCATSSSSNQKKGAFEGAEGYINVVANLQPDRTLRTLVIGYVTLPQSTKPIFIH